MQPANSYSVQASNAEHASGQNSDSVPAPNAENASGLNSDKTDTVKTTTDHVQTTDHVPTTDHVQISTKTKRQPIKNGLAVPETVVAEKSKNSHKNGPEQNTVITRKGKKSSKKEPKPCVDSSKDNVNKATPGKARGRKKKTTKSPLKTIEVGDDAVCMIVDVVDVCSANMLSVNVDPKDIVENVSCLTSTLTSNTEKVTSKETENVENNEKCSKVIKSRLFILHKQDSHNHEIRKIFFWPFPCIFHHF